MHARAAWLSVSCGHRNTAYLACRGRGFTCIVYVVCRSTLSCAGFQPQNAVALSNLTIVGGALANFAFNVNRRHPSGEKPLIDWDLIMVMEPTTILGALLGSYINKVRGGS